MERCLLGKRKKLYRYSKINEYNKEELGSKTEFTVKKVRSKIDWMLKKETTTIPFTKRR